MNEKAMKKVLEAYVSRNDCCFISSYNFIESFGDKYKTSVVEKDGEGNIFVSVYLIEFSDSSVRIIEMA